MIRNNYVIILSILIAGVCVAFIAVFSAKDSGKRESASPEVISSERQPEQQKEPFAVNHEDDGLKGLEKLREKSITVNEETLKIKKQAIVNGKEVSSVDQAISDKDSSIVRTARMKIESNATGNYTIPADSDRD